MAGRERFELEAAGVQARFELRVVVAVTAEQLPVPPGCVRDLRPPGEVGLLVVFADAAAVAGSAVLPVCP